MFSLSLLVSTASAETLPMWAMVACDRGDGVARSDSRACQCLAADLSEPMWDLDVTGLGHDDCFDYWWVRDGSAVHPEDVRDGLVTLVMDRGGNYGRRQNRPDVVALVSQYESEQITDDIVAVAWWGASWAVLVLDKQPLVLATLELDGWIPLDAALGDVDGDTVPDLILTVDGDRIWTASGPFPPGTALRRPDDLP